MDIAGYQLQRSRNGGDAQVISRQRAGAERTYVDRAVAPGDRLLYLIQGLGPDESVVASSVRQEVAVPE